MNKRFDVVGIACLFALAIACSPTVWARGEESQEAAHNQSAGHDGHDEIGHAGGVNADPTEIRSDLAIYTFLVFVLLVAVLWKYAWGPIMGALDTRERHMHEQLAAAERANAESQRLLAEHSKKMAEVQNEVRTIIDDARRDAQNTQQEMIKHAQMESQATRERAVREIEQAKDKALQELFDRAADVATEIAGKIVRRTLNPQDHRDLVAQVIKEIPSRN